MSYFDNVRASSSSESTEDDEWHYPPTRSKLKRASEETGRRVISDRYVLITDSITWFSKPT
jgi:hypothetical protein